jgi:hypothetical protein
MPPLLGIGALLLGAILLAAALAAGRLFGAASLSGLGKALRACAAMAGVALLAIAAVSYGSWHWPAQEAAPSRAAALPADQFTPSAPDLVGVASTALDECPRVHAPALPDGERANAAQMTFSQTAFKAYDAAVNSYLQCVDAAVERIAKQYKGAAGDAELKQLNAFGVSAHNTAIDQEQASVDEFNAQVRIYKAKHPGS